MREKISASFLAMWRRNQRSARLALLLLKAANVLYTDCGLEHLHMTHPLPDPLPGKFCFC